MNLGKYLLAAVLPSAACFGAVLDDFTDFVGTAPLAYFAGDWESSGQAPLGTFTQNSDNYEFKGGTNSDLSLVDKYLNEDFSSVSFGNINTISVTAMLLSGNEASSFRIGLVDDAGNQAFATFGTLLFNSSGFVSQLLPLTSDGLFDLSTSQILFYRLSGDMPSGTADFNIAFKEISLVAAPVPEPSTYALVFGVVVFGVVVWKRFHFEFKDRS